MVLILDEPEKERILRALADEYSRAILKATINQAKSAMDLSRDCNIPMTTVYRRLKELEEACLVAVVKSGYTGDGKWYDLYRSTVKKYKISLEENTVTIDVELNYGVSDKFAKLWSILTGKTRPPAAPAPQTG